MAGNNNGNGNGNGNGNSNANNKNIYGTTDNDLLVGNAANNKIYGDLGDDVLQGLEGNDHLFGEDGSDILEGGSGNDKLDGGDGNDQLTGGAGNDNIIAGAGNDQVTWSAGDGNDTVDGGDGEDVFELNTSENYTQTVALSVDSDGNILISTGGADGGDLVLAGIEKINLNISSKGAALTLGPNLPPGLFGALDEPLELGGGDEPDVIDSSGSDQAVAVNAGGGDDTVSTGGGNDVIAGGAGDDIINAGGGDDTVAWQAGEGNDTVDGGDGFDALDVSLDQGDTGPGDPPTLTIAADENGNVILQSSTGETLTVDGVEDIVINAAPAGSTITIGDLTGTDIAQDTLYFVGGAGVDSLDASATDRRINAQGNDGDDVLLSGSGNDLLDGGAGHDTLDAGSGSGVDTVLGGTGDDQIHVTLGDEQGSDAIDIIDGGADNDTLTVTFVEDTFHDLFLDVISNNDGTFSITSSDIDVDENVHVSNVENLTLQATEAGLHFSLGSLADTSLAANGVNFEGSEFNDFFDGSGTDVSLTLQGNAGDDVLVGGSQNDTLDGGTGNDSQSGEGGDDWLLAGAGDDILDGGADWDTADYSSVSGAVSVDLSVFQSQDTGSAGFDTLLNVEAVEGSAYNDTLTGNDLDNFLSGNAGDDVITGGEGFDTIRGGAGNDTITDSNGRISGDEGSDTLSGAITYIYDTAAVNVDMLAGTATDGYGDTDSIDQASGFLEGSVFGDQLAGSDSDQVIFGRAGADVIDGNGGNDNLRGGSGDDTIDGGDGIDFVNYLDDGQDSAAIGGVSVDLANGVAVDNWGNDDTLSNIENVIGSFMADTIIGDDGDNTIFSLGGGDTIQGGAGNDLLVDSNGAGILDGGDGNDVLLGARGNDTLTGGTGADTYRFTTTGAGDTDFGHDTITDFAVAEDILDLTPFTEIGAIEQLDITESGGNTVIALDADRSITLTNVSEASLTAANFLFGGEPPAEGPGTAGNDVIEGTDQPDVLDGLAGNDTIAGLQGNDVLDGGADVDTADYSFDPAGVTVDLGNNTATDGWGDTDTLLNFENINGSLFGDTLTGDDGNNAIVGDFNHPPEDTSSPPPPPVGGADTIVAGAGDDLITPGPGVDSVDGGAGFDTLNTFGDVLGGLGGTGVIITYGSGYDLTLENPTTGDVESHTSIELIIGSGADDTVYGNDQDNFFNGIVGNDYFDGGDGNDTFAVSGSPLYVDLNTGEAVQQFSVLGTATLVNVENVIGSFNNWDDRLIGNNVDNILEGHLGNDTLIGGAGNDTLNGGIATLINRGTGDPGIDTVDYSYFDTGSGVTVALGIGGADGTATDPFNDTDTLQSIENVIGTNYNDSITGNEEDNVFRAMAGDDTLTGGAGANIYVLNDDGNNNAAFGHDTVTDFDPATDSIDLYAFSHLAGFADIQGFLSDDNGDTLITFDAANSLRLVGVSSADLDASNFIFVEPIFINDDDNGNFLEGDAGNDTIFGNGGDDEIQGQDGDDFLDGGSGFDNIYGGRGNDTIEGGSEWDNLYGEEGDDVLTDSQGGGWISGGPGNDSLTGSAGDWNELRGDEGDDILVDPDGSGFLYGGPGNDVIDGQANYREDPGGVVINMTGSIGDGGSADVNGQIVDSRTAIDGYGDSDTLQAGAINLNASNFADSILGTDEFSQNFQLLGGDDWVFGGAGDDWINAGSGNDYIDGGDNRDGINFWEDLNDSAGAFTQGVVVNLSGADFEYAPGEIAFANSVEDPWGYTDQVFNIESVDGTYLDDVIVGFEEHNWLNGQEGNDQIYGGDGGEFSGDNLIGGEGDDLLDGQGGNSDTAWYNEWLFEEITDEFGGTFMQMIESAPGIVGVAASLESGTATDQWGGNDTLVNIENLEGSPYEDSLTGNDLRNNLGGVDGDDVLFGRGGDDNLWGDGGDDELYGEDGNDWLVGGQGSDLIDGGAGDDQVNYDAWTGTTTGVSIDLNTTTTVGAYTDVVVTPDGQGGTDYLRGIENITGTDADDTMIGNAANNSFWGNVGNDTLEGGDGDDWLEGGDDFDTLDGGAGDDQLRGGENGDTLTGGTGFDVFSFTRFTDMGNLTAFGEDVITDFEIGIDTLDFNQVPEFNSPEALASYAEEQNGHLVLTFDTPDGFGGFETNSITLENVTLADLPQLNIWYSPIMGTDGDDTLFGSGSSEFFQAMGGNDTVYGSDGNDNMEGGAGNDLLYGEGGDDWFQPGSGFDTIDGGADWDRVDYNGWSREFEDSWVQPSNGVVIDMNQAQQVINDGFGSSDTLISIELISGTDMNDSYVGNAGDDDFNGNGGDDIMSGGDGNDWFAGDDGNDQLSGDAGDDWFQGGRGNDVIDGGAGRDHVNYSHWEQQAGVTVNLATGVATDGFGDTDTLISIEDIFASQLNDNLTGDDLDNSLNGNWGDDIINGAGGSDNLHGDEGNDVLDGGSGNDGLNGANGNDTLTGGLGSDYLEGGAGDDLFVFADGDTGSWDHIEDFSPGQGTDDVIDLSLVAALNSLAEVVANANEGTEGTSIDLGDGNTLYLNGVSIANLHEDDFLFT